MLTLWTAPPVLGHLPDSFGFSYCGFVSQSHTLNAKQFCYSHSLSKNTCLCQTLGSGVSKPAIASGSFFQSPVSSSPSLVLGPSLLLESVWLPYQGSPFLLGAPMRAMLFTAQSDLSLTQT